MREKEESQTETEIEMWKYIFGFSNIAVLKCAFELGIAQAIENHQGPIPLTDLSSTIGCNPSTLHRIMRFLIHHNIFKEELTLEGNKGYIQTPLSRQLLGPSKDDMAALFLLESSPVMLAPWHFLSSRVKKNGCGAFEAAHGVDIWKYAAANSEHSKLINEAMGCDARRTMGHIVGRCKEVFDGVKTLVDVGGGNGTSLSVLVKGCPWIQGINFDLPHVVEVGLECPGVTHVAGDMFQSVPKADAALLMWVLHDWNDEECIHILKKCREAIPKENGKVIIVEAVVSETNDEFEFVRLALDMVMMAHTNKGKERTSKEWEYVLRQAEFTHFTIKSFASVQSVIEAFP